MTRKMEKLRKAEKKNHRIGFSEILISWGSKRKSRELKIHGPCPSRKISNQRKR